ncbi:PREDICTED: glutamate--cysteine ligase regulatory subunit [Nicrophorus vespilloides]|uniref:GCS light chain n=1 Tax=Nicrophorus vespilloides TaxID=110193 RepID=A0ABM1MYI3_NICVS|nr:PREDICTED: glutamate--cysteine ligase regulatory subunit [Nicrophorus vespilloides]
MANVLTENVKTLIVNTGNILSFNDITKNPGQNPSEELEEAIKLTISNNHVSNLAAEETNLITSKHNDLVEKMSEHDLENLKIGIKIFLTTDNATYIKQALDKAFAALNVSSVHNVIVSLYNKGTPDEQVQKILNIWSCLEEFVNAKKVQQIGLSDIEENGFRSVYEAVKVKPSIIQINLATCCVVPPTLQAFCKEHEVLLLTHSDPAEILPSTSIFNIFDTPLNFNWAVRFLVHIKCRGVLTTKGYILSLNK